VVESGGGEFNGSRRKVWFVGTCSLTMGWTGAFGFGFGLGLGTVRLAVAALTNRPCAVVLCGFVILWVGGGNRSGHGCARKWGKIDGFGGNMGIHHP
jgi:hypothetical protein